MAPKGHEGGSTASNGTDKGSDNLGLEYSSAADDGGESEKKREAAMLFSVAEAHLNDEAPDEVLLTASDALDLFLEIEDANGLADTLRLVMHATRMKAANQHEAGNAGLSVKLLDDVERRMRNELRRFEAWGNKRGQACMLLAIAEALNAQGGSGRRAEAMDCLLDARDLAREVADAKLEALIAFERANVLHKRHRFKGCAQASKEAADLFKRTGDAKNEGFAWYSLGAAEINSGRVEDGLRSKTRAMKVWRGQGLRKLQGGTLNSWAEWYLNERDDIPAGLAAAREARAIFEDIGATAGELIARGLIITGLIRDRDGPHALQEAKETVEWAKGRDELKNYFRATEYLVSAYHAMEDHAQALETAHECIAIAKDMDDMRWTSRAHELICSVHLNTNDYERAAEAARDSVDVVKDMKGYEEEAFDRMQLLARTLVLKDDYQGAHRAMEQARILAQRADDTYLEALAMLGMSGTHALLEDMPTAVKAATLARELYHEEGYTRGEARVLKALAQFAAQQGEYTNAVRYATEGATLMEDNNDYRYAVTMKRELASIHLQNDRPSEAAKVALEGLKLARIDEDRRNTVNMLLQVLDANNMVLQDTAADERQTKTYRQSCEKMLRFAKEALGLALKMRDKNVEAAANYWVGHLYLMQGKIREGMQAAKSTHSLAKETKDTPLEIYALVLIANGHSEFGEQAKAVQVLNEAITLSIETEDIQGQRLAMQLLEEITGEEQASPLITMPLVREPEPMPTAPLGGRMQPYRAPDPSMVRQFILQLVQQMTGTSDMIASDTPLVECGIDSLASVELRTQLQQEFRVTLPSTVMFNFPTISTMTRLLVEECTSKKIQWGG